MPLKCKHKQWPKWLRQEASIGHIGTELYRGKLSCIERDVGPAARYHPLVITVASMRAHQTDMTQLVPVTDCRCTSRFCSMTCPVLSGQRNILPPSQPTTSRRHLYRPATAGAACVSSICIPNCHTHNTHAQPQTPSRESPQKMHVNTMGHALLDSPVCLTSQLRSTRLPRYQPTLRPAVPGHNYQVGDASPRIAACPTCWYQ